MKKNFLRLLLCLSLFTIFESATASRAGAQTVPQIVQPTTLFRFAVSPWDGGHLLTGWHTEGPANGYTSDPISAPGAGLGIYLPPAGWTPAPGSGLVPLHRWLVIQDGWRTYFYYSTGYVDLTGTDYHYQGIAGYVFPPGMTQTPSGYPLHQLSVFYSQDLGYWNGYGAIGYGFVESPPSHSSYQANYIYHGIACAMPAALYNPQISFPPFYTFNPSVLDVLFYPPAPPPGGNGEGDGGSASGCTTPQGAAGACQHNGGWWDYETCTCEY